MASGWNGGGNALPNPDRWISSPEPEKVPNANSRLSMATVTEGVGFDWEVGMSEPCISNHGCSLSGATGPVLRGSGGYDWHFQKGIP